MLTSNPGVTGAHGGDQDPHCSTVPAEQIGHDVAAEIAGTTNDDGSAHTCDNPGTSGTDPGTGTGNGNGDMMDADDVTVGGWSSSSNGSDDLTIRVSGAGRNGS